MLDNSFRKQFVENINSSTVKYQLYENDFGFYSVTPIPDEYTLASFYSNKYYNDLENVSNKGMDVGSKDLRERFHFERQYHEIIKIIGSNFDNRDISSISILDVGCGTGELLKFFSKIGFRNLYGIEFQYNSPREDLIIHEGDLFSFNSDIKFDCILFNNVLEHVADPGAVIEKAGSMLSDDGIMRIQVPNDLSYLQYAAINQMKEPNYYFFCPPEHLHYFNYTGLESFLRHHSFEIINKNTFWPMELFLLMGLDYTSDKKIGNLCHKYRLNLEYNVGEPYISEIYSKLGEIDLGRVIIVYAKKNTHSGTTS